MNIINLCKDIINYDFSKDSYINHLIITKDLDNIKNYNNIKKICFISNNLNNTLIDDFILTNKEKIYETDLYMHFFTHKDYIEDITFIIAGHVSVTCNITRINCYLYGKFIQSSVDQHTDTDKEILLNATNNSYIIENNIYNQMYNIYRVLNQVDTEYCIKHRTDEYYTDMEDYINIMKTTDKLVVNNLFFRGINYHISDHIFGCRTINLKLMINNLKDILERKIIIDPIYLTNTEKFFGVAYLLIKYTPTEILDNEKDKLINNFYMYSIDLFKEYLFSTVNVPIRTNIRNKYQKNNIIFRKYRIYFTKYKHYRSLDQSEAQIIGYVDEVKNIILKYNDINEIDFQQGASPSNFSVPSS